MYIKIIGETAHPYSLKDLRKDNPQTSFPHDIPDNILASYDVFPTRNMERPKIDANQRATLSESFTQVDGEWVREWTVRTLTQDEVRAGMVCTRLQGRLALGRVEIDRLDAFINGFPNSWALRQIVDNSVNWRRTSQDMEMLAHALDYSPTQMDEAFIRAMAIEI
jgi:hypothetical protein